jgi:hypothetical protein
MEAVENKSKYVRRETRWHKVLRLLKKHIWVFPLLAIAGGLAIAWYMIRNIQAESTQLPEVQYERYLTPQERARQKEEKKLELYREKMKKEKQEKFNSRYERIISGSDLIGKADFGKIVDQEQPEPEKKPQNEGRTREDIYPETAIELPAEPIPMAIPDAGNNPGEAKKQPTFRAQKLPEAPPSSSPEGLAADSLPSEEIPADPFHILRASAADIHQFTRAHFYGEQDILSGSYVRLRLGEDMQINGMRIPRNTIFRGIASISRNKIEISIEQIGLQPIWGMVCDQDYNPGIVLPESRSGDMEQALSRSVYQQGSGSAMDIPYEIIQDLTHNIIRNKRRKQSTIRINDGYPVYITLKKQ